MHGQPPMCICMCPRPGPEGFPARRGRRAGACTCGGGTRFGRTRGMFLARIPHDATSHRRLIYLTMPTGSDLWSALSFPVTIASAAAAGATVFPDSSQMACTHTAPHHLTTTSGTRTGTRTRHPEIRILETHHGTNTHTKTFPGAQQTQRSHLSAASRLSAQRPLLWHEAPKSPHAPLKCQRLPTL